MATEKRLIDANALLLEIEEELQYESPRFNAEQNKLIDMGLRIAAKDIRHSPTIDAVEVVHGRWIYDGLGDGERICSVCRRYALYTHRDRYEQYLTNYCPNCGAIMDGVEDGK